MVSHNTLCQPSQCIVCVFRCLIRMIFFFLCGTVLLGLLHDVVILIVRISIGFQNSRSTLIGHRRYTVQCIILIEPCYIAFVLISIISKVNDRKQFSSFVIAVFADQFFLVTAFNLCFDSDQILVLVIRIVQAFHSSVFCQRISDFRDLIFRIIAVRGLVFCDLCISRLCFL